MDPDPIVKSNSKDSTILRIAELKGRIKVVVDLISRQTLSGSGLQVPLKNASAASVLLSQAISTTKALVASYEEKSQFLYLGYIANQYLEGELSPSRDLCVKHTGELNLVLESPSLQKLQLAAFCDQVYLLLDKSTIFSTLTPSVQNKSRLVQLDMLYKSWKHALSIRSPNHIKGDITVCEKEICLQQKLMSQKIQASQERLRLPPTMFLFSRLGENRPSIQQAQELESILSFKQTRSSMQHVFDDVSVLHERLHTLRKELVRSNALCRLYYSHTRLLSLSPLTPKTEYPPLLPSLPGLRPRLDDLDPSRKIKVLSIRGRYRHLFSRLVVWSSNQTKKRTLTLVLATLEEKKKAELLYLKSVDNKNEEKKVVAPIYVRALPVLSPLELIFRERQNLFLLIKSFIISLHYNDQVNKLEKIRLFLRRECEMDALGTSSESIPLDFLPPIEVKLRQLLLTSTRSARSKVHNDILDWQPHLERSVGKRVNRISQDEKREAKRVSSPSFSSPSSSPSSSSSSSSYSSEKQTESDLFGSFFNSQVEEETSPSPTSPPPSSPHVSRDRLPPPDSFNPYERPRKLKKAMLRRAKRMKKQALRHNINPIDESSPSSDLFSTAGAFTFGGILSILCTLSQEPLLSLNHFFHPNKTNIAREKRRAKKKAAAPRKRAAAKAQKVAAAQKRMLEARAAAREKWTKVNKQPTTSASSSYSPSSTAVPSTTTSCCSATDDPFICSTSTCSSSSIPSCCSSSTTPGDPDRSCESLHSSSGRTTIDNKAADAHPLPPPPPPRILTKMEEIMKKISIVNRLGKAFHNDDDNDRDQSKRVLSFHKRQPTRSALFISSLLSSGHVKSLETLKIFTNTLWLETDPMLRAPLIEQYNRLTRRVSIWKRACDVPSSVSLQICLCFDKELGLLESLIIQCAANPTPEVEANVAALTALVSSLEYDITLSTPTLIKASIGVCLKKMNKQMETVAKQEKVVANRQEVNTRPVSLVLQLKAVHTSFWRAKRIESVLRFQSTRATKLERRVSEVKKSKETLDQLKKELIQITALHRRCIKTHESDVVDETPPSTLIVKKRSSQLNAVPPTTEGKANTFSTFDRVVKPPVNSPTLQPRNDAVQSRIIRFFSNLSSFSRSRARKQAIIQVSRFLEQEKRCEQQHMNRLIRAVSDNKQARRKEAKGKNAGHLKITPSMLKSSLRRQKHQPFNHSGRSDSDVGRTDCVFTSLESEISTTHWAQDVTENKLYLGDKSRFLNRTALSVDDFSLLASSSKRMIVVVYHLLDGANRAFFYGCHYYNHDAACLVVTCESDTHAHSRPATLLERRDLNCGLVPVGSSTDLDRLFKLAIGGFEEDDDDQEMETGSDKKVSFPIPESVSLKINSEGKTTLKVVFNPDDKRRLKSAMKKKSLPSIFSFISSLYEPSPQMQKDSPTTPIEEAEPSPHITEEEPSIPSSSQEAPEPSFSEEVQYPRLAIGVPVQIGRRLSQSVHASECDRPRLPKPLSFYDGDINDDINDDVNEDIDNNIDDDKPSARARGEEDSWRYKEIVRGWSARQMNASSFNRAQRHQHEKNLLLRLQRTFGVEFRKLFGAIPSFDRVLQMTGEEYYRAWTLRAQLNLPGCSVGECPSHRNRGGYTGAWSIIHAAALALLTPANDVQTSLSYYLAKAAIAPEQSVRVREALFKFLTPGCPLTVALLKDHKIAPLKRPGDCLIPSMHISMKRRDDATMGLESDRETFAFVTDEVERLIGEAISNAYPKSILLITRYSDNDPIATLQDIARYQLTTRDVIVVSLVFEGPNKYAAALMKAGAKEQQQERLSTLKHEANRSAFEAKRKFDAKEVDFEAALIAAVKALQALKYDLNVAVVAPSQDDSKLFPFIEQQWRFYQERRAAVAAKAQAEAKEIKKANVKKRKDAADDAAKEALKEQNKLERKAKTAAKKTSSSDATIKAALDADAIQMRASALLAETERLQREKDSPLDTRWVQHFKWRYNESPDKSFAVFKQCLSASRLQPLDKVTIFGSTASAVSGFAVGVTGDIDLSLRWHVPINSTQASIASILAEAKDLQTRLELVAKSNQVLIECKIRNESPQSFQQSLAGENNEGDADNRLDPAPFGRANSGVMLEVVFPELGGGTMGPLKLQYQYANPVWSEEEITNLQYSAHKQCLHSLIDEQFVESLSPAAAMALHSNKTVLSPQRLVRICGNAVRFLNLKAEEAASLFQSVVKILADTVDPSNADTDKLALIQLRTKLERRLQEATVIGPALAAAKLSNAKNEAQTMILADLLIKRNGWLQTRKDGSKEGVMSEQNKNSMFYLANTLRSLTDRIYQDALNGQRFDWKTTLVLLAQFLRDPVYKDVLASKFDGKQRVRIDGTNFPVRSNSFTPATLSEKIHEWARFAPDCASRSRIDQNPAPQSTRPQKQPTSMTTIKQGLYNSLRGTDVQRKHKMQILRKDAETLAPIIPAGNVLLGSALIHHYETPNSPTINMTLKAEKGEAPIHKTFVECYTSGLGRKATRNVKEKDDDSPITEAWKRFVDDQDHPRNKNVRFAERVLADASLIRRQATMSATEFSRYYTLERKGKLFNSLACLFRRTILYEAATPIFAAKRGAWIKFAIEGSNKAHEGIIMGLSDEILKIKAKGLKSVVFSPLAIVKDALVKKKLILENEPLPPFILGIVKAYSDVFWGHFEGVLSAKEETSMRHTELKALLNKGNNKVEMVGRLYHFILNLTSHWHKELPDFKAKPERLIEDFVPVLDANELADTIDGVEEELHEDLDEFEDEDAGDDEDDIEDMVDGDVQNAAMPAVFPPLSPSAQVHGAFNPFFILDPRIERYGKRFYIKSFFMVPMPKKKIRSIAITAEYIKGRFNHLPEIKAIIDKEDALKAEGQTDVSELYMTSFFDRPRRKKETAGASVVTNGHYCSILYNKTGYLPEDDEKRAEPINPNSRVFHRHKDAERFPLDPTSAVRHWRRVVSVDPGHINLLTTLEILANGEERTNFLTSSQFRRETDYKGRNSRAKLRCSHLAETSPTGVKGAFVRLTEKEAWGKTSDPKQYASFMSITFEVSPSIFEVTLQSHWADDAFRAWFLKMKCLDSFWSLIKKGSVADGTHGVQPIIAYGDAQFASSIRGRISAPTTATYRSCVKINHQCNVVLTCEHRSTYTCSSCTMPLQNLKAGSVTEAQMKKKAKHFDDIEKGLKSKYKKWTDPMEKILHGVKKCVNPLCPEHRNPYVNRDINASRNILRAFYYADLVPQTDPSKNMPSRPPHMDVAFKVHHAAQRAAAPKPGRLRPQTRFPASFLEPENNTENANARFLARKKYRDDIAIKLDSTAVFSGTYPFQKRVFPVEKPEEGKGGGRFRTDHWPLDTSTQSSSSSTSSSSSSHQPHTTSSSSTSQVKTRAMPLSHKRRFVDTEGSNLTSSSRIRLDSQPIDWRSDQPWLSASFRASLSAPLLSSSSSPKPRDVRNLIPSSIRAKLPYHPTELFSQNPTTFSSSFSSGLDRGINPFSTVSVRNFSSSFPPPSFSSFHVQSDGSSNLAATRQVFKSDRAGVSNSKHVSTATTLLHHLILLHFFYRTFRLSFGHLSPDSHSWEIWITIVPNFFTN